MPSSRCTMSDGVGLELPGSSSVIPLHPFHHQVGGHSRMFTLREDTICKPLAVREHSFYRNLPAALTEFTAEYHGDVSFKWLNSGNGYSSTVPVCNDGGPILSAKDGNTCCIADQHAKSLHLVSDSGSLCSVDNANSGTFPTDSETGFAISTQIPDHRQKRHEKQPSKKDVSDDSFILLQNLTHSYRFPSILDLKMGTRQHGDDASEAKRLGHMKKCAESTSSSLGFRVCGMQVYQATTGQFIYQSKYCGRRLSQVGVQQTLRCFLHDGQKVVSQLIEPLLSQLCRLHEIISHLDSYRFYSCSLLLIYDADSAAVSLPRVKLVDFAHATYKGFLNDAIIHIGPDRGLLFGLESLMEILEEILTEMTQSTAE